MGIHLADDAKVKLIETDDMPDDGTLAVVVRHADRPDLIGELVRRYDNALSVLNAPPGMCFPEFFRSRSKVPSDYQVRMLCDGEELVYTR